MRGRPAKQVPVASEEAVRKARKMIRESGGYEDAVRRVMLNSKKRPLLFRMLKVDPTMYEKTGRIEYDRDLASRLKKVDREFMEFYEQDMWKVWILEHGIKSIQDERTRAIAEDTLLKGISAGDAAKKYGVGRMTAFREKNRAIRHIAALLNK